MMRIFFIVWRDMTAARKRDLVALSVTRFPGIGALIATPVVNKQLIWQKVRVALRQSCGQPLVVEPT